MSFEVAEKIADAVLFEGYALFPYGAGATKNQMRWMFGVLAPHVGGSTNADPSEIQTECLVESGPVTWVTCRVRGLQLESRIVERETAPGSGRFERLDRLELDGRLLMSWDEGLERTLDLPAAPLHDLLRQPWCTVAMFEGGDPSETVGTDGGRAVRIRRERSPVHVRVRMSAEPCAAWIRLQVRLENTMEMPAPAPARRVDRLRHALVGTHMLFGVRAGRFLSPTDPPPEAAAAAAECQCLHTWPALIGEDVLLSAPFVLGDQPAVAPQSPGDLFDGTEIDELLVGSIGALTDAELREARATDPRVQRLLDRCAALDPATRARLHGIVRASLGDGAAEHSRAENVTAPDHAGATSVENVGGPNLPDLEAGDP